MRHILLWMARNRWLKEHLPRLPFARRAVRRFMPGETVDEALAAAEPFRSHGIGLLFTRLGENLANLGEAQEVADHYHALIDEIATRGLDGEISVKLTQLGLDLDPDATFSHALSLSEHAARTGKSAESRNACRHSDGAQDVSRSYRDLSRLTARLGDYRQ